MTDRKNLKITEDTYDLLREKKRDMETWDSLLRRLADENRVSEHRQITRSWVSRFLDAKATVEKGAAMPKDDVYQAFQSYIHVMDDTVPIPKNEFGRAIQSIDGYPVESTQRRIDGKPTMMYTNIRVDDR